MSFSGSGTGGNTSSTSSPQHLPAPPMMSSSPRDTGGSSTASSPQRQTSPSAAASVKSPADLTVFVDDLLGQMVSFFLDYLFTGTDRDVLDI